MIILTSYLFTYFILYPFTVIWYTSLILYFRSSVEFLIFVFIFLISKSFFFCYLKDKLKKTPLISCIRGLYLRILMIVCFDFIFPCSSDSKASAYNAGDPGLIPRSGRFPGEGNGNPLQYSCLENPMD